MKLLGRVYIAGLLIIFGLIVLHAPLSVYFGAHFGHVLLFKAWKELLMGVLLILAAVIVTLRREWRALLRDPVIWLSAPLALLYTLSLEYGQGFKPYAAGLLIDLRYVLYLVLVYVAARLFPVIRRPFLYVGLAGAIVVIVFGLLQFVLPKDFLSILGYSKSTITPYTTIDNYEGLVRLQSTLRGPNPLGAYGLIVVLIAAIAALTVRLKRWQKTALWILAVAALVIVYASYSRSAYAGVIVGAVAAAAALLGSRLRSKKVIIGCVVGLIVVVGGVVLLRTSTFYSSVLNHEVAGSGPSINSNEGHSASLEQGSQAVLERPLGHGTGSTGSASLLSGTGGDIVENQYLYVAHEAGWLALVAFVALYAALLERAYRRRADPVALGVFASGVGLFVIGLVLPVFADDTVSIVWFGLAGLIAGGKYDQPVAK